MFPQVRTCRRKGALSALLVFFLVALAAALDEATANTTLQDLSHLYLVPDAPCAGHEGQWNCLSDRFQHCADGQWSAVLSCSGAGSASAVDTGSDPVSLCSPLGKTDIVDFEGECSAAWGWGGSGGGGGGWGGGGVSCNGNGCYRGTGTRLGAGPWVYVSIVGAVVVRLW
ncbi:hypothetical protein CGRA01v4_05875 [Colletotrichum graminicola]|uniref:SRCR domain-containing protein n=1 Tax=Colletotrichum graminicola (strain M1.001 / M2 / FGSC 10212) TaxID=645133 RepID=E3QNG2_COLGM|nr:uncharacterized protein GLRG_07719 [Colletotrichum graminicola M1.001]EFQ32449.1 hypothetical protein GLRG_07719 [Colletotrichum graminicola M1.001]WDK14594.1 hypothetical protein CGRA01v4_05875 [Colletotrichum graminicola]